MVHCDNGSGDQCEVNVQPPPTKRMKVNVKPDVPLSSAVGARAVVADRRVAFHNCTFTGPVYLSDQNAVGRDDFLDDQSSIIEDDDDDYPLSQFDATKEIH